MGSGRSVEYVIGRSPTKAFRSPIGNHFAEAAPMSVVFGHISLGRKAKPFRRRRGHKPEHVDPSNRAYMAGPSKRRPRVFYGLAGRFASLRVQLTLQPVPGRGWEARERGSGAGTVWRTMRWRDCLEGATDRGRGPGITDFTYVSHEMWVQRPLLPPDRGAAPRTCRGVPCRHGRDPRTRRPLRTQK
jgi:hypothetical protein